MILLIVFKKKNLNKNYQKKSVLLNKVKARKKFNLAMILKYKKLSNND